ncbi:MAG: hypothetical protein K6D97_07850, partial [Clostridia bacterium]|nr:hypothetical protein [Clostridia bacterium]
MNIKDLQIMLSVCDTLEKYKLYSINDNDNDNEKERANKGYIKYAKLILNIIQGCLGKLDGELSTIDNINRISFRYNEFEISFILVGNNLKIFLTINENNTKNKNDNN